MMLEWHSVKDRLPTQGPREDYGAFFRSRVVLLWAAPSERVCAGYLQWSEDPDTYMDPTFKMCGPDAWDFEATHWADIPNIPEQQNKESSAASP